MDLFEVLRGGCSRRTPEEGGIAPGRDSVGPAEAHDQLNDAYLKLQGQASGVRSYGHVTDLMLEYFAKNGTLTQSQGLKN